MSAEIAQLARAIIKHQRLYDKGKAEISDAEFDALVERMRKLDPEHPVLEEVGTVASPKRLNHVYPMLSLEKAKSAAAVLAWATKLDGSFVLSPKYDGLALSLTYKQGQLISAVTRGDGSAGDDVLHNAKHCPSIPQVLRGPYPPLVTVRGEVLFARGAAEAAKFANLRNGAAGTMLRKTPDVTTLSVLNFVAYDILTEESQALPDLGAALDFCDRWGFDIGEQYVIHQIDELPEFLRKTEESWSSQEYTYECDGAVLKLNAFAARERLGATAHHPRWAIAYKYQQEAATTKIERVLWQVSRTGALTPVAEVAAVKLAGATVTRATLHNVDQMTRLEPEHRLVGATVSMSRRGGVIPHVESVQTRGKRVSPPQACPECRAPVLRDDDGSLRCAEPGSCVGAQIAVLHHWCATLDLLGWGEEVLRALWAAGVRKRHELYACDTELLGLGKTLGKKLARERDSKSKIAPATFLAALGFRGIGKTQAKRVMEKVADFEQLIGFCEMEPDALRERYTPMLVSSLYIGVNEQLDEIRALLQYVELVDAERTADGPLAGHVVVFTGRMPDLDREEARALVRSLGGETPDSVTMKTTHLVVGSLAVEEQRTKRDKAERYNAKGASIQVITEDEFLLMVQKE